MERLTKLRLVMKNENIDIYMVPSADPHLSEYFSERFKSREYLTGFTGSAGTFVITQDEAGLFTDGRYFIQAEKQLEGTTVDLYKMKEPGVPTLNEWLDSRLNKAMVLGYDGRLFDYTQLKAMKESLENMQIKYSEKKDLIEAVWKERPGFPEDKVYLHEYKYTGANAGEKIKMIREKMNSLKIDKYLVSSLNDIAWLFNIRCSDVKFTPVPYAYAVISLDEARLYINSIKITEDVRGYLEHEGVTILDYSAYYDDIKYIKDSKIFFDSDKVNGLMISSLDDSNSFLEGTDFIFMMKGRLSQVEINNLKNCQVRDGVAMVNFLHWMDKIILEGRLTEKKLQINLNSSEQSRIYTLSLVLTRPRLMEPMRL
jgi:Xaa-Pro aminopeptidase